MGVPMGSMCVYVYVYVYMHLSEAASHNNYQTHSLTKCPEKRPQWLCDTSSQNKGRTLLCHPTKGGRPAV